MKYKHTPGPWRAVDKRPNSAGFSIFSGSQYIGFIGDSDSKTNCAGNAHLIEAAPELLKALELLIGGEDDPNAGWRGLNGTDVLFECEYCGALHDDCTLIEHKTGCPIPFARSAIAKARGKNDSDLLA